MKIDDFVVGLGFDYNDAGARAFQGGIDFLSRRALQLGGVIAGGFAFNELTFGFAEDTDRIGKFSEALGVVPDQVRALGVALELSGGRAGEALGQLEQIAKIRQAFQSGKFDSAPALVGFDSGEILRANDALSAYLAISEQLSKVDNIDRRNEIANTLGLSQSSRLFLSQDPEAVRNTLESIRRIRPLTDEMTESAAKFKDAMLLLSENVGSISDQFANRLTKSLTNLADSSNEFFEKNRESIQKNISDFNFLLSEVVGNSVDFASNTFEMAQKINPVSDDDFFQFIDNIRSVFGDDEAQKRLDTFQAKKDADADIEARAFFNSFIPDVSVANVAASLSASRSASSLPPTVTRVDITDKTPIQVVVKLDGKVLDDHIERRELIKNAQILEAVTTPVDD